LTGENYDIIYEDENPFVPEIDVILSNRKIPPTGKVFR